MRRSGSDNEQASDGDFLGKSRWETLDKRARRFATTSERGIPTTRAKKIHPLGVIFFGIDMWNRTGFERDMSRVGRRGK